MDLTSLSLAELGTALVIMVVALAAAWILWRILKRAIGGCISMGLGCLVLMIGLAVVAFFLLSRAGLTSFDDLLRWLGL
jgi:hypothetical protein